MNTSLGNNFADFSANLLAGKNGIRQVTGFDVSSHPCQIGGQVAVPECPPEFDPATYDRLSSHEQFTICCCIKRVAGRRAVGRAQQFADRPDSRPSGAEWQLHWDFDTRRGVNTPVRSDDLRARRRGQRRRASATDRAGTVGRGGRARAATTRWLTLPPG